MAYLPANVRRSVDWLKYNVSDVVDRFLPARGNGGQPEQGLPAVFTQGGPAIEVMEEDAEIRVVAELPGVDQEDFTVELVGDRLVLRGEKRSSHEERKGDYYYSERSFGTFARTVHLPAEVDVDQAHGTFKNGVLKLVLPKTESGRSRRIRVKVT